MEPTPPGPLTPGQIERVARASKVLKRLRSLERLATWDYWLLGVGGCLTLGLGVLDPGALVFGALLVAGALAERRGCALLAALDRRAPRLLALNQVAVMLLVVIYACVGLVQTLHAAPGAGLGEAEAQLSEALGPDPLVGAALAESVSWARELALLVYGGLLLGALVMQGGLAWYYWSRRTLLAELLDGAEPWVLELLRRTR